MSLAWIITGIILLGAMTAAGISLWFKRRKDAEPLSGPLTGIQSDLTDTENEDLK